jgi:signal transduction histidine kinase
VSVALAVSGWCAAGLLGVVALRLARRVELGARAEHELRGPVTVLRLALERLRHDANARRHAPVLEAQLERLCAGLADLTAARGGRRAESRGGRVDLARMLHGTVEGWRAVLAVSGRELRVRWQRPPGTVAADPGRFAQALGNLLSNACEHGSGPVELRALPAGRALRLEVENVTGRSSGSRCGGGRGLEIAAAASQDLGADLELVTDGERRVAALELPADDAA